MPNDAQIIGTSLESFAAAAEAAFADIPGDPDKEGLASASVARMWLTKGGAVGRTQYHVELQPAAAESAIKKA